eukprot:m.174560 g.174560  ORF g.174560 m.174560 type:complete len:127 (-) comp15409_c0_seq5:181-561(-)
MHSSDPNFESVRLTLARILPFLEAQRELQQNVAMIEPIKELVSQESNTSFLSKRQQGILENAEELLAAARQQPNHLDRLFGMVTDLFIDMNRFKGLDVKRKVPMLVKMLESTTNLEEILDLFERKF